MLLSLYRYGLGLGIVIADERNFLQSFGRAGTPVLHLGNADDQAFGAYGDGFAGWADAHCVQIQVPALLRCCFLPLRFREVIFVGGLGRSHNDNAPAF